MGEWSRDNPHMKEATNEPTTARPPVQAGGPVEREVRGSDPLPPPLVVSLARAHAKLVDQGVATAAGLDANGPDAVRGAQARTRYFRHRTLAEQEATMAVKVPLAIGDAPIYTKADVFVYDNTKLEVTMNDLAPHLRIGTIDSGISVFFMARGAEDGIDALNRFVNFVAAYRDDLLAKAL
jgi:hypothetical protein